MEYKTLSSKTKRIQELNEILQKASYAYYGLDNPIMSDKEYDDLYDELSKLEEETGCILAGSPTQKVQGFVLEGFEKVKHTKPMLSANKTKDIEEIKKFMGDKLCVMSWKEDGLTIVLRYKNGVFDKAITRGADGLIGEDVTHTMKMCKNIPLKIPYCVDLEVRGECVISWEDFEKINSKLEEPKKHPRNLAAGTVRQLNSLVAKDRNIKFKAFELVQDDIYEESKTNPILANQLMNISDSFMYLKECGFDVVEHDIVGRNYVEEWIKKYDPSKYEFPVDGIIFTYEDYLYGKSLGETSHHTLNMIALKWSDELYETTLRDIEWNTSKTGLINPIAVFDETIIEGASITKATLHNISYIENLQLGIGDKIQIYKANKIIPKVHDNLTRSNTWTFPDECPVCGGITKIVKENDSKVLMCDNPNCKGKLLGKLTHAVSKNALNIDGMSEATIEFLIERGWLSSIKDIYKLDYCREPWKEYDGFGDKSVDRLLDNIETSRKTTMAKLLYSLSIPLIGKSVSKDIANHCQNDIEAFVGLINEDYDFTVIDGFGTEMQKSLSSWWKDNRNEFMELLKEFEFESTYEVVTDKKLEGLTFVITGSLINFGNRTELQNLIESKGGKVSGSVSAKTSYLVNNDKQSSSSKNQKAQKLNIPIISEEDFIKMIGE